ncbi:phosphopantetheine adenylyltransferase [Thermosporothrix hazakensis]|jgi:pantetheine-phosphate adenylyltransferase|uniref:Phosphopantetheine adenylyltransferase n=2 Tax=Thermosporothrix TaxID=768650 RepID=A0A326UVV7_THEHA|nr:pantetheine-phosphate adenylyltransferase [Thermosporothrix hazakensis]PZW36603.1 phosphopantetheine adenylyltransferase [Thermosporothrix hazakensis]BBH89071.1 phosphopantetheine adenylyltransferase [Thermosporothrix sp. COM3]GCE47254.1 phosphopantetheine adenylyltransferase [Thermosporothrix hazakensis]
MNTPAQSERIAVYPGSFDPATNGHLDIARRAAKLFDTVIIAVYAFPAKNLLFSVEERVALWQEILRAEGLHNVRVDSFSTLLVEYVRSVDGIAIIKGLRSPNDFDAEFRQGLMNRKLAPEIETVCLFTNLQHLVASSSLLKEVARLGGDVSDMLPPVVVRALQQKYG